MIGKSELIEAREELLNSKSTIQNCEKLAAVCTVLDHCYPNEQEKDLPQLRYDAGYSGDDIKADTQFMREIKGKSPSEYLPAVDELVTAVMVYNPRLYKAFIRKLTEI